LDRRIGEHGREGEQLLSGRSAQSEGRDVNLVCACFRKIWPRKQALQEVDLLEAIEQNFNIFIVLLLLVFGRGLGYRDAEG
jgi:hypothetical protein